MSTAKKKSIKDNAVAALKTITTANGYNQSVASDLVFAHRPMFPNQATSFPALFCFWESEVSSNERLQSMTVKVAMLTVGVWTGAVDDPEDAMEKLCGDVEKALMVSRTRGGYAIDTALFDLDVDWRPPGSEPSGMAYMTFAVTYRHAVGNPF